MRALERQGRLDRAVEFLPDTAAMRARAPEPPVSDAARAFGAAGLRQDRSQRRDPATPTCPTIRCSRASCCATSRRRCSEKYRAGDPRPSAAPRDRGAAGRELAGQSLRADLRAQYRPAHRRAGRGHRPRLRRGARRLEAARPVGRHRSARSRAQGRGADPHAGGLAALPDARRAMDAAPPAAADRHHGRDRAAGRRRGGAGRPAARADRRGRECRAGRARRGLRGDGRAGRHRPPRGRARNPGRRRRPDAGGARQRLQHRGGGPRSISGWASGCRSPAWRRRRRSCRARASGRHRRPLAVQDELAALHADLLASALRAAGATGQPIPTRRWRAGASRASLRSTASTGC